MHITAVCLFHLDSDRRTQKRSDYGPTFTRFSAKGQCVRKPEKDKRKGRTPLVFAPAVATMHCFHSRRNWMAFVFEPNYHWIWAFLFQQCAVGWWTTQICHFFIVCDRRTINYAPMVQDCDIQCALITSTKGRQSRKRRRCDFSFPDSVVVNGYGFCTRATWTYTLTEISREACHGAPDMNLQHHFPVKRTVYRKRTRVEPRFATIGVQWACLIKPEK